MQTNGVLASFLLLSLTACAPRKDDVRPVAAIEVGVPVFVALPSALTTTTDEPMAPAPIAVDADGLPTVTNEQLAAWFDAWRTYARQCAAQIRSIRELQPDTR